MALIKFIVLVFLNFSFYLNSSNGEDGRYLLDAPLTPGYLIYLARAEIKIRSNLGQYSSKDDPIFKEIQNYLEDYDATSALILSSFSKTANTWFQAVEIVKNPIAVYRMMRRFAFRLKPIWTYFNSSKETDLLPNLYGAAIPTTDDFYETIESILNLHQFYDFNPIEFANGKILTAQTKITLKASHTFEIARYAVKQKKYSLALAWFKVAQKLNKGEIDLKDVDKEIEDLIEDHDATHDTYAKDEKLGTYYFSEKLRENPNPVRMRDIWFKKHFKLRPTGKDSYASVTAYYNLMGICGGNSFVKESDQKKLFCTLNTARHPFFILNPIKLEVMSWSPYVAVFHEAIPKSLLGYFWSSTVSLFLNATNPTTEILEVKSGSQVDIMESLIVPEDPRAGVKYRIRPAPSIAEFEDEDTPERFLNYIELLSDLKVKGDAADSFRVNAYLHGPPLRIHCDHLQGHDDAFTDERGDRIASFLVFLTAPEVGGGTAFPNLGFKVEAELGSVIYWDSALPDGTCDFRMAHEGCYAALGLRWTSVKLIRQRANIFRRKCSTREGFWLNN